MGYLRHVESRHVESRHVESFATLCSSDDRKNLIYSKAV